MWHFTDTIAGLEKAPSAKNRNCTSYGSLEHYGAGALLTVSSVKKDQIDTVSWRKAAKFTPIHVIWYYTGVEKAASG